MPGEAEAGQFLVVADEDVTLCVGRVRPGAANASIMASHRQVVAASVGDKLGYVVVDTETGRIVHSELIDDNALGTEAGNYISGSERYW